MVVFDKFVRGGRVPLAVRLVNPLARVLFTEMTRDFEAILTGSGAPLVVARDAGRLPRRALPEPAAAQDGVSYCGAELADEGVELLEPPPAADR